MKNEGYTCKK